MSLASIIIKMCSPPKNPIHSGTATSWLEVQSHFHGVLPECLNEYGRTFGSGYFESNDRAALTYQILNPHDPAYISNIEEYAGIYTGLREDSPQYYPYSCFPEENGLFPVGITGGSTPCCLFYLLLTGSPEKYTVVFDDRFDGHLEFPGVSLFHFIEDVFCQRIGGNIPPMSNVFFVPQQLFFRGQ